VSKIRRPLLSNVYNKNTYFSSNGVKTSPVSAETNTLTTAASETVKLKDSTRCLLDRPTDGYNRPSGRRKLRDSRTKKTPDRRGTKQTEVKEERTRVQADVEALVLCS
jgi:hypothetical protein